MDDADDPIAIPINGDLDLHTFRPSEVGKVIDAYFFACLEKGIFRVRVVHGKGAGTLRTTTHALLRKHPLVKSFRTADEMSGGWGATWAELKE
jgi:DNA-nicking Smr family endonuclease